MTAAAASRSAAGPARGARPTDAFSFQSPPACRCGHRAPFARRMSSGPLSPIVIDPISKKWEFLRALRLRRRRRGARADAMRCVLKRGIRGASGRKSVVVRRPSSGGSEIGPSHLDSNSPYPGKINVREG